MSVPSSLLDSESATLTQLEAVIQTHLTKFLEVGEALSAIRDARLYRATHATFEDYCRDRWQMTRSYANRLITSASVLEMVPIGAKSEITTESQARELAKVPPARRAAVIKRVRAKTGGRVTAAAIREEVAPAPVTNDTKTLGEWVKAHDAGMPVAEIARSYKVPEADVRGALQLAPPAPAVAPAEAPKANLTETPAPAPEPAEAKGAWSLPRWGERLRAYLANLIDVLPAEHRSEAKWHARQIATELFAESAADPKPEPWGNKNVIPPLPEWVTAYSAHVEYPLDGEAWCDAYSVKGWKIKGDRIKDWQACVRTWKKNNYGLGNIALAAAQKKKMKPLMS